MSKNSILLFVYGTLLSGYGNNRILSESSVCMGDAITAPQFTMYFNGGYPALIAEGTTAIKGELYAINEVIFERTDRLECYTPGDDSNLYERKQIDVTLEDGSVHKAWVYYQKHLSYGMKTLVESGNFKDVRKPYFSEV